VSPRVLGARCAWRDAPVALKARQHEQTLLGAQKSKLAFDNVMHCAIPTPHALIIQHITLLRQVLSLISQPEVLARTEKSVRAQGANMTILNEDAIHRARNFWRNKNDQHVRDSVARFIGLRDIARTHEKRKTNRASGDDVVLTNHGATVASQLLLRTEHDAILVPIPDMNFSAAISLHGGRAVGYRMRYFSQEGSWSFCFKELEKALLGAKSQGSNVRALVVSNPGLCVADIEQMQKLVRFCEAHSLLLLADEVHSHTNQFT